MDRDRRSDETTPTMLGKPTSRRGLLKGLAALMTAGAIAPLAAACAQQQAAPAKPAEPAAKTDSKPGAAPKTETKPGADAKPVAEGDLKRGGTLKVALIGEVPHLDPMFGTQTVTRNVMTHVFETLYAKDAKQAPTPLLVDKHEVSGDAKTWKFTLRKGVPFHNDKEMTSADAVASLKRWGQMSVRGQPIFARLDTIEANDSHTFTMSFKQPTGALLTFLAEGSSFIIPEDVANALPNEAMKTREQLVGTGPFKFVEHQPDRHVRVQRWEKHVSPEGPSSNMAGKRVAYLDEIMFIPVPEGSVRVDGVGTNEYHFGESLQPDQYDTVRAQPGVTAVVVKPYYWVVAHFNKKEGMFTNVKLRQAVQAALSHEPIAKSAVGREDFYRLDPSIAAPETAWFTDEGKEVFNKPDPDKAKRLIQEAGYDGTPIRWMSTKEYFYNYNGSLPIKQQLEAVGFKVDLQVMDWATLGKRRSDSKEYDVFVTGHEAFAHPMIQPYMAAGWPGWWVNEQRDKLIGEIFAEADEQKQMGLIKQLQALQWQDVPCIKLVEWFQLHAVRNELKGYDERPDWFFWNAGLG